MINYKTGIIMGVKSFFKTILIILAFFIIVENGYSLEGEINDQDITAAVKNELLIDTDRHIRFSSLGVYTKNGIVTLTGNVDNLLSKERAARITEIIKGVRAVINRIEVAPATNITDQTVHNNIEKALLRDPATDLYKIDTSVNDCVVTLNGIVDSWQEKSLVESVVKEVRGVIEVKNQIKVRYKEFRPDKDIEFEIKKILRMDVLVNDALINVNVKEGIVYLSGTVGNAAEKSKAFNASFVAGVKSVDATGIDIQEWVRDKDLKQKIYNDVEDKEIRKAVEEAFLYDPRVDLSRINVYVDNGVVTLQGEVDSLKAKRAAGRDCMNTVGIIDVNNLLSLKSDKARRDASIRKDIIDALSNHPHLHNQDVKVIVDKGIVYLSGSVDSVYEKVKAEKITSSIKGVMSIDNNLSILDYNRLFKYNPYIDD
jgi:osmotically-inducible protein OsmY